VGHRARHLELQHVGGGSGQVTAPGVTRFDMPLPRAMLLDLDDTILDDSRNVSSCWRDACLAHASALGGVEPATVFDEIERTRAWYWSDPERHRAGRLRLADARRDVVDRSLTNLGLMRPDLAHAIASHYESARDRGIAPLDGAIETVRWLRDGGCRLALLTNGDGRAQRSKIDRFGLAPMFEHILIEGELGYGKPDRRVYESALGKLEVAPHEAWMVGDNLEWDVVAPESLGIRGIWIDTHGRGLPRESTARPWRIIRRLAEITLPG
jgi:putative hydrolase of the HAD superfamily